MELAVIHDLAECIVGDITPHCGISADEKRKKEQAAMEQITRLMPTNGLYMRQLFDVRMLKLLDTWVPRERLWKHT